MSTRSWFNNPDRDVPQSSICRLPKRIHDVTIIKYIQHRKSGVIASVNMEGSIIEHKFSHWDYLNLRQARLRTPYLVWGSILEAADVEEVDRFV